MARIITFAGKKIVEPGVYSQILGGNNSQPVAGATGKVMIVDTGSGAGYGFGSGAIGDTAANGGVSGIKSVYEFTDPNSAQAALRGGLLWDLVPYLFKPSNDNTQQGVSALQIIRAASTTAATVTFAPTGNSFGAVATLTIVGGAVTAVNIVNGGTGYTSAPTVTVSLGTGQTFTAHVSGGAVTSVTFTGSGSGYTTSSTVTFSTITNTNGGSLVIAGNSEGVGANGVLNSLSNDIKVGYAFKLIAGVANPNAFALQINQGTFKGNDANGIPFDEVLDYNAAPIVVWQSQEFTNFTNLLNSLQNDFQFKSYFTLVSGTAAGTGQVTGADLATYASYVSNSAQLFAGGTETYNAAAMSAALEAITEEDNLYFLCDQYRTNAENTNNFKILSFIQLQAKFAGKMMYIGGGYSDSELEGISVAAANAFNTGLVTVCHGGIVNPDPNGSGNKQWDSIYFAALAIGRRAGLAPQVPTTQKDIAVTGTVSQLGYNDRVTAIQNGVMHLKKATNGQFVINLESTTLSPNDQDIYPDGQSPYGSIMAIAAELNQDIVINLEQFIGQNAATASPTDVVARVKTILQQNCALKGTQDGLLLSFDPASISATLQGSDYYVTFGFTPNGPINRMFVTGVMFNINISA